MSFIYVLLSLILLYLSKHRLTFDLHRLIHRLGGNRNTAIVVWSFIFLPGTIVHEISHFLAAAFTGARTGKIEIFPEYLEEDADEEERGTKVALGYVQTQRLNPIQGFLVGTAPFISGLALLIFLASLLRASYLSQNYQLLILQGYFFFTIANSFFPSWVDIQQTIPFIVLTIIAALAAWFFGLQIFLEPTSQVWDILNSLWQAILISVDINIFFLILISILRKLFRLR